MGLSMTENKRIWTRIALAVALAALLLCGAFACAPAEETAGSEGSSQATQEATEDGVASGQAAGSDDATTDSADPSAASAFDGGEAPDGAAQAGAQSGDVAPGQGQQAAEPSTISVRVSVNSSRAAAHGYPSSMGSGSVSLPAGASAYDALCALGVSVGGSSSYVSSINGLAEFACGPGSGWMYGVNGSFPRQSAGSCKLHAGDSVIWVYTLDFGNDI